MEQRIGPNIPPLQGAAVDPAFVPGITGPRPAGPDGAERKDAEPKGPAEKAVPPETAAGKRPAPEASVPEVPVSKEDPAGGTSEEAPPVAAPVREAPEGEPTDDGPERPQAPDGGPVFEASDRRAKVVADHSGVRLRLDDQEAEFRWDEIGAVETESPRFGKRFTITVHTPDRRWYPLEIEATARSRFKEWEAGLDEVLDAYFEEAEETEAAGKAEETEAAGKAETAEETEAAEEAGKAEAAEEAEKTGKTGKTGKSGKAMRTQGVEEPGAKDAPGTSAP